MKTIMVMSILLLIFLFDKLKIRLFYIFHFLPIKKKLAKQRLNKNTTKKKKYKTKEEKFLLWEFLVGLVAMASIFDNNFVDIPIFFVFLSVYF